MNYTTSSGVSAADIRNLYLNARAHGVECVLEDARGTRWLVTAHRRDARGVLNIARLTADGRTATRDSSRGPSSLSCSTAARSKSGALNWRDDSSQLAQLGELMEVRS